MLQPIFCTWSPDGRYVACATGNGYYDAPGSNFANASPGQITLCRVSDGRLTALTDNLSLNTSPAWSSDGRWLYFVSNRYGQRDIYAAAVGHDGTAEGEPLRLSAGLGAHSISSSRAGTSLVYSLFFTRSNVWWMPLPNAPGGTTANARRITNANENIENIEISKDQKWLYYDSDLTGNADIFRIPVAGGEAERLTTDPADDFAADPSPDGKSFAFHSWRSGSRDIYVQQLDGSGVVQVTRTPLQEAIPVWSPDGNALTFGELTNTGGLWIVRRNAQGEWGAPVRRLGYGYSDFWSPDGKMLLFFPGLIDVSIDVVPVDSGPVRTVYDAKVPGALVPSAVQWKDDRTILFSASDAKGTMNIYSIPLAGGTPHLLFRFDPDLHPSARGTFVLSGGRFFFTTEDRQADLWVVQLRKAP